jgi:hypothetical protein
MGRAQDRFIMLEKLDNIAGSLLPRPLTIYSIATNRNIMLSVTKRRRGSVAHSRLYWRTMGDHVCGGVQFMYCPCRSVWCKQFLQRNKIEYE